MSAATAGSAASLPNSLHRVLAVAGFLAALTWAAVECPMLRLAANRLVTGTPLTAGVLGTQGWAIVALCLGGSACLAIGRSRVAAFAALVALGVALVLFAVAVGTVASDLVAGQPPAARARLASGAWIVLILLLALSAWACEQTRICGTGWLFTVVLLAALVWLFRSGRFDGLSLAVEYRARATALHLAIVQHVVLSAAAVALAVPASAGLYLWRAARPVFETAINGLQVVPAIALLGALVASTSGLLSAVPALRATGLTALGPGPAVFAVSGYLLLPLWRGLAQALRAPDPASLDAATAVGLKPRQILFNLRLPLGALILVSVLRVASVQAIGLSTLGALVGAGGLGSIVFDGMAQFAPDLILLGALPVIGLSLTVERGLSLVEDYVRARWHR